MRSLPALLLLTSLASFGAAAQTITFPNASPAAAVKLEAGSQVSLDANGNLIARCDATDPTNGCARLQGTGGGQCGTGVTFTSQLGVINPATPPAPGPFPGGSQLTLQAQMTGASVCTPSALQGATSVSINGWTSPLVPSNDRVTQVITLPTQPDTTYTLRLTCFGSTGSAVSERTVRTSTEIQPPPPQCPTGGPFTSTSPGSSTTSAISGVTVRNVIGFEELVNISGTNLQPFPQTGVSGILDDAPSVVRVIRFTVPNPFIEPANRRFNFLSYPNGFNQGNEAYISVSTCPGDFRIPTATQTAPQGDPNYAESCRNWRGSSWTAGVNEGQGDLPYTIGSVGSGSSPSSCVLIPGQTYYLNIFMNRPALNRTLPVQPQPPNTVCQDNVTCGHRVNAGG